MREKKWTKGPWEYTGRESPPRTIRSAATGSYIGNVHISNTARANGNLISAAPDLVEALEAAEAALVDLGACDDPKCKDCPGVLRNVRAALAKAYGEAE